MNREFVWVSICIIELTIIIITLLKKKRSNNQIEKYRSIANKNDTLYQMALKWSDNNYKKKTVYDYLVEKKYNSIAIYGMHYAGEQLVKELYNTDIRIVCGIDQNASNIISKIPVIKPTDEIPKVDAIIVTAVTAFMAIDEMLYKRVDCPIISLEDIIYY